MAGEEGQMGNVGENRKVSVLLSHLSLSATGCGTLRDRRVDTQHTLSSVYSCWPEANVSRCWGWAIWTVSCIMYQNQSDRALSVSSKGHPRPIWIVHCKCHPVREREKKKTVLASISKLQKMNSKGNLMTLIPTEAMCKKLLFFLNLHNQTTACVLGQPSGCSTWP